jgi:hypothetical protein
MRVEFDTTEVDDPGKTADVVNHDLFRGTSRRKGERDSPQP